MAKRDDITPRYLDPESPSFREDLARLAESVQQALDTIPLVSFRWLRDYKAGASGDKMPPILWGASAPYVIAAESGTRPPDAAFILRVLGKSPGARLPDGLPVNSGVRLDFDYAVNAQGQQQVTLYQTSAMRVDEVYDVLIMFVAGTPG